MQRYRSCLILFTALYMSFFAFGADQPRGRELVEPQTFKVEGTVINRLTGRPLARALVQWNGQSGQVSVLSDSGGGFSFDGVPEGRAHFTVQKPGYFQGRGGAFNQRSIQLNVGPDATKLVLALTPEAVIFGRVLGKSGEPMEGAVVRVERPVAHTSGRSRSFSLYQGHTDEEGNYRIANVPPGQYLAAVQSGNISRRMLGSQSAAVNEAYPLVVYYPSGEEELSAERFTLTGGQHMEINFSLATRPAYRVAGTVIKPDDAKQVSPPFFVDRRGRPVFTVDEFDQQTGAFAFRNIPAGTYTLRLSAVDDNGVPSISQQRISVHKELTGLRLAVGAGREVAVHLRKEMINKPTYVGSCSYGDREGKIHTSDCSDYPSLQMELDPLDPSTMPVHSNWLPPAGDALVLRGIQPGRYKVRANSVMVPNGYVASLTCGGLDLLHEQLVVPDNGQLPAIEAVIRDDQATLHLQVNGDKNTFGTVAIFSSGDMSADGDPVRMMSFSTDGVVNAGLPPGDYKIFAFADSADISANDAEEVLLYAKKAASVTLLPGKTSNVVVDVIRTGE